MSDPSSFLTIIGQCCSGSNISPLRPLFSTLCCHLPISVVRCSYTVCCWQNGLDRRHESEQELRHTCFTRQIWTEISPSQWDVRGGYCRWNFYIRTGLTYIIPRPEVEHRGWNRRGLPECHGKRSSHERHLTWLDLKCHFFQIELND